MFLVFLIFFSGSMKICHLYILSVMSDEYSYFCYHEGGKQEEKQIFHHACACLLCAFCLLCAVQL